jgi:hypothetical protein
MLKELSCAPFSRRVKHVHLIEQKSNATKSIIIVSEIYSRTFHVHRYNVDGQCIQHQKFSIYSTIMKMKSEGQIGVLLFEDGELQIINWLTFEIMKKIENKQLKWNESVIYQYMKCLLLIRDAYHLLPINEHQFDCQPQVSTPSLPSAVIVCGFRILLNKNQLFVYHLRSSECVLMNSIELDKSTNIQCIDIFRGD